MSNKKLRRPANAAAFPEHACNRKRQQEAERLAAAAIATRLRPIPYSAPNLPAPKAPPEAAARGIAAMLAPLGLIMLFWAAVAVVVVLLVLFI